jgi:hypothetical protein
MRKFEVSELVKTLGVSVTASQGLSTLDTVQANHLCEEPLINVLVNVLARLETLCVSVEPDSSLMQQISQMKQSLESGAADKRSAVLKTRMTTILDGLENNLASRLFMFIPSDRARYFGDLTVWPSSGKFDSSVQFDMMEAGTCYAAGRDTATVFHAMRVAEHGLRGLAKKLRIKLTHKQKNCPIEFADWEKIVTEIKNKIVSIRQLPTGQKRQTKLGFYSDAADHCLFMKDIWRNNVSHTRKPYKQSEALSVLERVRDFMKFIGENL